jgi:hypothetical protein
MLRKTVNMESLQLNTLGSPSEIEAGEKRAVEDALKASRLPTPNGNGWDAIKKFYSLPDPEPVDRVQSKVTLPPGWTIKKDPSDPYGRCCIITDHEGEKVGSTFLKNTGYDYYGNTHFNKERLQKLGILE